MAYVPATQYFHEVDGLGYFHHEHTAGFNFNKNMVKIDNFAYIQ